MQSTTPRSAFAILTCFWVLLIGTAPGWAQQPPTTPIPVPTAVPIAPSISAPPVPNPEQTIPVVITYGEGLETRAAITQGLMLPVGVPRDKSVTVSLLLPSAYAGQPVALGLYDGGQVRAAPLRGPDDIGIRDEFGLVPDDGKVRFNFQAGPTFGLYRLLVTVGPNQYLLQFYAVRPRPPSLAPVPNP